MDPALEQAVTEIRDEAVDDAVVEAAAARVWARAGARPPVEHAAHPRLRRFSGADPRLPRRPADRSPRHAASGPSAPMRGLPPRLRRQSGGLPPPARAAPPAVHIRPLGRGRGGGGRRGPFHLDGRRSVRQPTPAAPSCNPSTARFTKSRRRASSRWRRARICPTASKSAPPRIPMPCCDCATARVVELRERSGLSTTASRHAISPSGWAAAASSWRPRKRRSGHLFVDTADCRVAVTGTLFGVSAGVKGSRVSVVQGEVHVARTTRRRCCIPAIRPSPAPAWSREPVRDDIAWSRNRDRC